MRKIALTLISCVLFSVMSTQSVDIQGVLMDSVTKKPVTFANIGIAEKSLGTVSDENGNFSLAIPDSLAKHDLTISRIGYQKTTIAINSFRSTLFFPPSQFVCRFCFVCSVRTVSVFVLSRSCSVHLCIRMISGEGQ